MAKKVKYKLLNGVIIEGRNIKRIIELIGDRIFIPEHCNPNNYDYNKHFKHLLACRILNKTKEKDIYLFNYNKPFRNLLYDNRKKVKKGSKEAKMLDEIDGFLKEEGHEIGKSKKKKKR